MNWLDHLMIDIQIEQKIEDTIFLICLNSILGASKAAQERAAIQLKNRKNARSDEMWERLEREDRKRYFRIQSK